MNRHSFELLGVLAALGGAAVGCKDTPVASNVGTPTKISTDFSSVTFQGLGKTATVTARVVDQTNTPIAQTISVASCNTGVVTAVPADVQPVPATALATTVTSTGLNSSCFVYTSNGVAPDTVQVIVLPTVFSGALSSTTPSGGSILVIHSTATLKFNPATATVTLSGAPIGGIIVGASADSLAVLVPFGTNGPLTISGIKVTYVTGLEVTLSTVANVVQTGNYWAADSSWQTAPDITSWLPAAAGDSTILIVGVPGLANSNSAVCAEVVLGFGSTGPCGLLKFTNAGTDTLSLNLSVDWDGTATNPDVDMLVCADTVLATMGLGKSSCGAGGFAAATGSKPQATGPQKYAPGKTYWIDIETFCSGDPNEVNCTGGPSPNHYLTIFRQ